MKISSRDALHILRQYRIAGDENVPRNISSIKTFNPSTHNMAVSFNFLNKKYYLLVDDMADDDVLYATNQVKIIEPSSKIKLINLPNEEASHYTKVKGKISCLFTSDSKKNRLDVELVKRYPEISRNICQKYIKNGLVSINGNVVKSTNQSVTEIDNISVDIPKPTDFSKNKLPIIYIDDNVIVINKPNGVLSHSKGTLNDEFTVAGFLDKYTTFSNGTNRPGIVHRLDRDTSGIIIGARNNESAELLQKQFSTRKTKKTYIAIVVGKPKLDKANIDLPILRNPSKPSTFKVDASGKSAKTYYEIIASNKKYSLLRLNLETGRTHQLRVHMDYINTPILGDRIYGANNSANRLYLHAYSLEITIPEGNRKKFIAPLPIEFYKYFPDIKY